MRAEYHPACTARLPEPFDDNNVHTIASFMINNAYCLRARPDNRVLYFYPEKHRQNGDQTNGPRR